MTGENALEHRYRRLLAWYPAGHRRTYAEEMIGVLMAAAPEGSSRPGLAGAVDLVRGGLTARFRSGLSWLAGTDWPDALAVCSVAVPVILASYLAAGWLHSVGAGLLHGHAGPWYGQAGRGLIVLAIAAPPLLALRSRRTAVVVAVALAGWYVSEVFGSLPGYMSHLGQWTWLMHGDGMSSALLVSTGVATTRALAAAELLAAKGVECTILHVHTLKPFDTEAVLGYARDVPVVVTIEEHTLIGGLGSAVTEALVERFHSRLPLIRRLGIPDVFAVKYGNQDELMAMYGLQPPQIAEAVREALKLVSA